MTLAHLGVGVLVVGVTASAWQVERIETMRPGDSIDVAGYSFRFEGAQPRVGPNYTAQRGRFTVTRAGAPVTIMQPEKRFYPVRSMPITDAAIHTNGFADLYAVMSEEAGDGAWVMRLYYNPLVPWIWFGPIIMTLGGLVSLSDRRLRIGAPARRTAASPIAPARA
jgi:cytochrome c-type biogenesis protein CcmF